MESEDDGNNTSGLLAPEGTVSENMPICEKSASPEWFQKYIDRLEAVEGPEPLKEIIQKFPRFEMALGFPTGQVGEFN